MNGLVLDLRAALKKSGLSQRDFAKKAFPDFPHNPYALLLDVFYRGKNLSVARQKLIKDALKRLGEQTTTPITPASVVKRRAYARAGVIRGSLKEILPQKKRLSGAKRHLVAVLSALLNSLKGE